MSRNALIVGALIVAALAVYFLSRGKASLAAQNPTLTPFNPFGIVPPAGPNTPVNTWGSAPYTKNGAPVTTPIAAGPSTAGIVAASSPGILNAISSFFRGSSAPVGTVSAYPGGPQNQPYNLLDQSVIGPAQVLNPAVAPIPAPSAPMVTYSSLSPTPPPPDIASGGTGTPNANLLPTLDTLNIAPPSPIVTASDSLPIPIGDNSIGYVAPDIYSNASNYAQPSYPLDGGEIPT